MEESIVIPSPNWFLVTVLGASNDGWVVYGGPCKSLVFLEPISSESIGTIDSKQRYKTHFVSRAHKERIVSVDICPEWPEKRNVITGGAEGVVKEWSLELTHNGWSIQYLQCHEYHGVEKEEVAGVCYGSKTIAVSVGTGGNICKWDLTTNIVKSYYSHLRGFKPTCISCSPHKLLHVAVGTRQGVIFVVDISGPAAKLIYKVRGQDDEINRVCWCPQYIVSMNKAISREKTKKNEPYTAAIRMERIRNDQDPSGLENTTPDKKQPKEKEEEVIIPEDDMFDVYKDHEANEFGHKKYEPEDVVVKVKEECKDDFLAECAKLKAEILKKKNEPEDEESIESLVEAMDKAHFEKKPGGSKEQLESKEESQESKQETQESKKDIDESAQKKQESEVAHTEINEQKHLLASIGKFGGVRIWSKTGTQIASCSVAFHVKKDTDYKNRGPNWPTLTWFKADSLVIADGKNQLLEANPLKVDSKNKLDWRVVHTLHRRGLYCVTTNAPRVQTPATLLEPASNEWVVWTVGQDRNVISYNMTKNEKIEVFVSSGGFVYDLKPCPYDAGKIAIGVGDGSIRIWETHTTNELEDQLASGVMTSYWQNVQGKVLTVAWHPTKENLLAFSTAECRVGVLDASGNCEKPAKSLPPTLTNGVYSLCWGERMMLYACGGGKLALFRADKIDERPEIIKVEVDGRKWEISLVLYTPHGLLVGSYSGGLALLDHNDRNVITANIVFMKTINSVVWHPQQITSSHEDSKYKNYIAVASVDKSHSIGILEFDDKEGVKQFKTLPPLVGHEGSIFEVYWNPHREATLLSTSQDATVRVWNVKDRVCLAIFGSHCTMSLGAMWCAQPSLADKVITGGGDCCVRLWDIKDYPAENFAGLKSIPKSKKARLRAKSKKEKERLEAGNAGIAATAVDTAGDEQNTDDKVENAIESEDDQCELPTNVAATSEHTIKAIKTFLLPMTTKQLNRHAMTALHRILTEHLKECKTLNIQDIIKNYVPVEKNLDFLKLFGTINDINDLLDRELDVILDFKRYDSYMMLNFYRGKVDETIKFAYENLILDSYILSLSPSVSFKCWKDTMELYYLQINRIAAQGGEDKNSVNDNDYGGAIFRKATALLCLHNLKGAVNVLLEGNLFKEAYMLCRMRHMDSVAQEVLLKWAQDATKSGALMMGTLLHLVRGDIAEASTVLARSKQTNDLCLARELAKLTDYRTFVAHIDERLKTLESEAPVPEDLPELPTRAELFMKDGGSEHQESDDECNGNPIVEKDEVKETLNGNTAAINGNKHLESGDVLSCNGNGVSHKNGDNVEGITKDLVAN